MFTTLHWIRDARPHRLAMMARPRSGDWLADEIRHWKDAGLTVVASLLEAHEVRELELADEPSLCQQVGIEFLSFPIRDRGVPGSMRDAGTFIDSLQAKLITGGAMGVHCRAGIGRSGLIAACLLAKLGMPFADIFPALSRARGVAVPDTPEQMQWVRRFAEAPQPR